MDDVSCVVAGVGAVSDDTLDVLVRAQTEDPLNFKELTEVILAGPGGSEFFLATVLATAIIRLALLEARS
jgi:hypothetical protein